MLSLAARVSVMIVLCVAPWWYGGVELDIQVLLNTGVLAALAFTIGSFAVSTAAGRVPLVRLPMLLVPLMGGLVLGAAQLAPPLLSTNRPRSLQFERDAVLKSATQSIHALLPGQPVSNSIYPAATRLELARLGFAVIACYLGAVLFQDSRSQIWLWSGLAMNGGALAFFGIVQQLSWNGKLFWTVPLLLGGQPFASFVNRNNAAGYLNVCLAAALGVAIWCLFRSTSEDQREMQSTPRPGAAFDGPFLSSLLLAGLTAAGILCSVSRGGILAMIAGLLVVILLMRRAGAGILTGLVFTGALGMGAGLVYWTGLGERLLGRWNASAGDTLASGAETRLSNWFDAFHSVNEFPLAGTGLGTYSLAYLPFQSWMTHIRFYNADNQFVETLIEGGAIGLALVLLGLLLVVVAVLSLARNDNQTPAGIVGAFVVISQTASACFDFGPTMYANMMILAVLLGAITGRAATLASNSPSTPFSRTLTLPDLRPVWMWTAIAVAMLGYGLLQYQELSAAADCRVARRDLPRRLDVPDAFPDGQLDATIHKLTGSLQARRDDAESHLALATLLMYRYRCQAHRDLQEFHKRGGPRADWLLTDPLYLATRVNEWRQSGQSERLRELNTNAVVQTNLTIAYQHLVAAQKAAPLMPGLDIRMATLAVIVQPETDNVEMRLRRAVTLSPMNPDVLRTCAAIARSFSLLDFSTECLQQLDR
jgi:O-antigen ligase